MEAPGYSGTSVDRLKGHSASVLVLDLHPSSQLLASGSEARKIANIVAVIEIVIATFILLLLSACLIQSPGRRCANLGSENTALRATPFRFSKSPGRPSVPLIAEYVSLWCTPADTSRFPPLSLVLMEIWLTPQLPLKFSACFSPLSLSLSFLHYFVT